MDELTLLAGMIGAALVVVVVAISVLIRSGRVVHFPMGPAAWWAERR